MSKAELDEEFDKFREEYNQEQERILERNEKGGVQTMTDKWKYRSALKIALILC